MASSTEGKIEMLFGQMPHSCWSNSNSRCTQEKSSVWFACAELRVVTLEEAERVIENLCSSRKGWLTSCLAYVLYYTEALQHKELTGTLGLLKSYFIPAISVGSICSCLETLWAKTIVFLFFGLFKCSSILLIGTAFPVVMSWSYDCLIKWMLNFL